MQQQSMLLVPADWLESRLIKPINSPRKLKVDQIRLPVKDFFAAPPKSAKAPEISTFSELRRYHSRPPENEPPETKNGSK
jgi:hypothetical protein